MNLYEHAGRNSLVTLPSFILFPIKKTEKVLGEKLEHYSYKLFFSPLTQRKYTTGCQLLIGKKRLDGSCNFRKNKALNFRLECHHIFGGKSRERVGVWPNWNHSASSIHQKWNKGLLRSWPPWAKMSFILLKKNDVVSVAGGGGWEGSIAKEAEGTVLQTRSSSWEGYFCHGNPPGTTQENAQWTVGWWGIYNTLNKTQRTARWVKIHLNKTDLLGWVLDLTLLLRQEHLGRQGEGGPEVS